MSKLICANCEQDAGIGHYDYKKTTGETVSIIFLCDTCKMLMKSVDLSFTLDEEKVKEITEIMGKTKKQKEGT